MTDDGWDGVAVELRHHFAFSICCGAGCRQTVEAQMGLTWSEIVGAGLHHHFVSRHQAEVDEEVLGRIIVGLNVGVREGWACVFGRVADFPTKFSVHAQKFTDRRC